MNQVQLSPKIILLLSFAVGAIAANLYYAQPIVALISHSLGLAPEAAGLVVTLTQAGYGLGVLLIVPLGDIVENRHLILSMIAITILGLLGLAYSTQIIPYFIAAFATGLGASTVQIIVPYAAHFSPEAKRGQLVGSLMSGLMIGIMLSRPIASLLTDFFSWHAVFVLSGGFMILLGLVLYKVLPTRPPTNKHLRYRSLLLSMVDLFLHVPLLRRRAIYQACFFAAFCLFWTASPLLLAGTAFHLSQTAIAIFALVGVSGAIFAPLAGKAADRGWMRAATTLAMIAGSTSFLLNHFFSAGSTGSLIMLIISAILLDAGVSANLVLGQRAIFTLPAKFRGRLNGLYIATIFVGGSIGSTLGAWAFARGGWELTSWVGFMMPAIAFIYFLTEKNHVKS